MPFGLKNAGSTYQWMMTKMFEPQLGRSIEVYIDDIVVKRKVVSKHVEIGERRVGKESLGQALLRSVKSTYTCHFLVFFFTTTILASH